MPAAGAEGPETGLTEGLAGKERRRADAKGNQEGKQSGTSPAAPRRRWECLDLLRFRSSMAPLVNGTAPTETLVDNCFGRFSSAV